MRSVYIAKQLILSVFALLFTGCHQTGLITKTAIGHWEGTLGSGKHSMKVALNFSEKKCYYDVPSIGIYGAEIRDQDFNGDRFTIVIPEKRSITLKGKIVGTRMTGEVLGKQSIPFVLEKKSETPELFPEEAVVFKSGEVSLSGTLIKPTAIGNYPVVVMIHGSSSQGKMTRETTRSSAILFVKSGIAALIYDRRGNGKSTGENDRILKMELLAKDAAAGVDFLALRKDIIKNRIGVYGISQGGWVAPYSTSYTNRINFLITVSAPGVTPDEQNEFAAEKAVKTIIERDLQKASVPDPAAYSNNQQISNTTTREIIPGFSHFNPLPYWENIKFPVLAIWGSADEVVPAEKSKNLIETAMVKAKNSNYTLKIFPNGDHLLKLPNREGKNSFKPMVEGVQEFMTEWIQDNLVNKD